MKKAARVFTDRDTRNLILDILYLASFAALFFRMFISSTKWQITFPENYNTVFLYAAGISGGLRILSRRNFRIFTVLFMAFVCFSFSKSWLAFPDDRILMAAVLIPAAYGINYKYILKTVLLISVPVIAVTVVCSRLGFVEEIIYYRGSKIRMCLGFAYPTNFASHVFFTCVSWMLVREKKAGFIDAGVFAVIAFCLYRFCDARCSTISLSMLTLIVIFFRVRTIMCRRKGNDYTPGKAVFIVCIVIPLVMCASALLLAYFYDSSIPWMAKLNSILSDRIRLGNEAFRDYYVNAFGQFVRMYDQILAAQLNVEYFFLDSSYIWNLFKYGVCGLISAVGMYEFMIVKNRRNAWIMAAAALISIHSFVEHHMIRFDYCPIVIMAFASFEGEGSFIKDFKGMHERLTAPEPEKKKKGNGSRSGGKKKSGKKSGKKSKKR